MNKTDLINVIAPYTRTKRAAKEAIDDLIAVIEKTICDGEPVRITGFGTFEARPRKSRLGRNPQTGERVVTPARAVPVFRASDSLRESVSRKLRVVEDRAGNVSLVRAVR